MEGVFLASHVGFCSYFCVYVRDSFVVFRIFCGSFLKCLLLLFLFVYYLCIVTVKVVVCF